ncbi:DinB family protein [Streptomyces specialis]|uniref:DinB family protein n=1 Tax=Streptomyces specialis TaxID=498367 RepID=UPI00073F962F|nr:DinB family protein [Streptomyces specialis]
MTTTTTAASNAEIRALLSALDGQRRHVLGTLDGLDTEALRRPVLPSGWNCLGLVQHLALDVERFWFRAVVTGDPAVIKALDDIDDAWQVAPDVPHTEVLDRYRTEADLANTAMTETTADTPLAWWPHHLFGEPHLHTVRDVLLHVITETACHAGHLDAARELIDGRQWKILT